MAQIADNPHHERRWLVLGVLALAQLMVVLDATVMNVALPSAQHALGFSNDIRQWVVTGYALAFGSLLLLGGRLSDMFGRKWTLIGGLLGFAIASAIGGAATSSTMLIGARALQGAFAAVLAPAALSLLSTTFTDKKERATAFGIYGAIVGSGAAAGLLLGGVLTEYLSWRWSLYVNLVIAVPTASAGLVLLHNQRPAVREKLDLLGTITVVGGLFGLVYGFSSAQTNSWTSLTTVGFLAAGVVLLALFVTVEQRVAHPLLPMRVVLDRDRAGSYLALGIASAGMYGVFLFLTYYLQQTLGFTPLKTGLAFLPMIGALMVAAIAATTRLQPKVGPRPLVVTGMIVAAAGMLLLTHLGIHSSYLTGVVPALVISGIGLGLVMAPSMNSGTYGVADDDSGVASAMTNTSQQIGGAIGTAVLSTFFASAVSSYLAGRPHSLATSASAAVHGYTTAFWWSAGIFALGAIITALVLRPGPQELTAGERMLMPV
jgi:EmrB/QacA subfamily drug resistance transporter